MSDPVSLLLIDANHAHAEALRGALLASDENRFQAECVGTLAQGLNRLLRKKVWAIFSNLSLPDSQGLETLDKLLLAAPDVPILILGATERESIAMEGLRRGAKDYLLEGHIDADSFARAIRSMTERTLAEELLFAEKQLSRVALNSIGYGVVSTNILGNVIYLNSSAEKMTGWACAEALGRPLTEVFKIIDGGTREAPANQSKIAEQADKTAERTESCILLRRDSTESAVENCTTPIHDRSGLIAGTVTVFHEVNSSIPTTMSLEMSHLAHHDSLTGLPNRLLLRERLCQAIATAHQNDSHVALMYLDLDGFKHINDSLGHAIGDRLLRSVARRLVGSVRCSDTVGRQGGDEFAVLLTDLKHLADAGPAARGLLTALGASYRFDSHDFRITASIGISIYPEDGEDAETLMKNADTALYQAKVNGPNNHQFFKKYMNVRAIERQSIEADLNQALEKHEFVLHYQPQISLATGEITGAEALIRWQHPNRGLVPPAQFISIAEDSGLILPIGQWVIRETCRQVHEWIVSGLHAVSVSVNVSSLEFRSESFLESLRTILKDNLLDPCYLGLELTETAVMRHAKSSIAVLEHLKSIGVSLSLDDFGTGYSSLGYLKWIPIDCLKIDQSFIQNVTTDTDDATIVSSMIAMAKGLKKRVVAEGVETEEQIRFLQAQTCDDAQGYYFSKPVVASHFAKLLKKGIAASLPRFSPASLSQRAFPTVS
jgi:diguanylate cyclase (GGDEF)-like protein/PAS domain S-box-containing protein